MAVIERGKSPTLPDKKSGLRISQNEERLVIDFNTTRILVETAKRPGKPWAQKARADIETARASYRVIWGDVPAWDKFDRLDTTFNYIAYVEYPSESGHGFATEALSNRMVTEDTEDLTFYQYNGTSLNRLLEAYLYYNASPRPIAGESRIGAIRPPNADSNYRTVEAFAAIKLQMVQDAHEQEIEYIACQLPPNMPVNIYTIDGIRYDFPATEDVIGLPKGSIRLDRDNPTVVEHILNYPGYFLDTNGIYRVVQQLIKEKKLPKEEFRRQTGLEDIDELLRVRNIKTLVPLIHADNRLGITLQDRLLNDVPDGTYSSLSHIDDIEQRAMKVLEKAAELETS